MHLPEPNARAHRRRSLLPHAKRLEENRTFDILDIPLPTCSRLSEFHEKAVKEGGAGDGTGGVNQGHKEGGEEGKRFGGNAPRKLKTDRQDTSTPPVDIVQEFISPPMPPERTLTQECSSVPPGTPGPEYTLPLISRRRKRYSLTERGNIHLQPRARPLQPLPSLSLSAKQIVDGLLRHGIFGNDVTEEEVGQLLGTRGEVLEDEEEGDKGGSRNVEDLEAELVVCLDEFTIEGPGVVGHKQE